MHNLCSWCMQFIRLARVDFLTLSTSGVPKQNARIQYSYAKIESNVNSNSQEGFLIGECLESNDAVCSCASAHHHVTKNQFFVDIICAWHTKRKCLHAMFAHWKRVKQKAITNRLNGWIVQQFLFFVLHHHVMSHHIIMTWSYPHDWLLTSFTSDICWCHLLLICKNKPACWHVERREKLHWEGSWLIATWVKQRFVFLMSCRIIMLHCHKPVHWIENGIGTSQRMGDFVDVCWGNFDIALQQMLLHWSNDPLIVDNAMQCNGAWTWTTMIVCNSWCR